MAWVSLTKWMSEFEKRERLLNVSMAVQSVLVGSLRRRLLEVDVSAAKDLKSFLLFAMEQLERLLTPEELESLGSRFERDWGMYYEKSDAAFRLIKKRLDETTKALEDTLGALARESEPGAQERLGEQVSKLRRLSALDLPAAIRDSLQQCVRDLEQCANDLKVERTMLIAQMRDEIGILHRNLEMAKQPGSPDCPSGCLNRQALEDVIGNLIRSRQPFTLVYIWLRNFRRVERELLRSEADRVIATMSKKMTEHLPKRATVGRWSDDEFCALVEVTGPAAIELSRELSKRLEVTVPVTDNPSGKRVTLSARVGLVGPQSDSDPKQFLIRAGRLIKTLQGAA